MARNQSPVIRTQVQAGEVRGAGDIAEGHAALPEVQQFADKTLLGRGQRIAQPQEHVIVPQVQHVRHQDPRVVGGLIHAGRC